MADLPEAGAKLTLDLTEWEKNWSSAEDTATGVMDSIPLDAEVSIDIALGDDSAVTEIEALDGTTIEPELNTTETDTGKEIRDGITFLATIEKIKIAIDVIGTAWEFIQKIGDMVVTPFLDVEDAVAKINARTGGTGIEDLGQLIRDLQFADLGESVDQIGDVIIKAQQLGLPIKEAATAALTFTHTWTEEDPSTVIGTLGTMVQTGLVDNLQEASDLMTVFFQQGGNIGGDALAVVQEYAQAWADMGLNGSQALSVVQSLQHGTGAAAGDAAKMVLTFDDALTAAAADPGSEQAKMLKLMGISNPKDQGEAIGAETINGFAEAFANMPSDQQDLVSGMFFGKGGKKWTGAIENMTTEGGPFASWVGAAEDAAAAADDSLRGIIDDFVLAMNEALSNLLSSDAIDLPGKIEALKKGLQEALGVLAEGGSVGEALEIGLNIQGADDFLTNLERIFGNIGIILLQAIAAVQSLQGVDNKGTLAMISSMGQKQLAFDLQVANPDEVSTIIDQALQRGVTSEGIGSAMRTALEETIASGDLDDALNLADAMQASAERNGDQAAAVMETWLAPFRTKIEEAIEEAKPETPPGWWDFLKADGSKALEDVLNTKTGTGGAARTPNWWDQFNLSGQTADLGTDAETALMDAATGVSDSMTTMKDNVGQSLADTQNSFAETTLAAQLMDTDIAAAMLGNTVTTSFQAVADKAAQAFPSVMDWFVRTSAAAATFDASVSVHFRSILKQLNDINFLAMTTIGNVTQAAALGGGAGGGTTVTNNNVVVNNNVPNGAAATANGYAIARTLRGG